MNGEPPKPVGEQEEPMGGFGEQVLPTPGPKPFTAARSKLKLTDGLVLKNFMNPKIPDWGGKSLIVPEAEVEIRLPSPTLVMLVPVPSCRQAWVPGAPGSQSMLAAPTVTPPPAQFVTEI